MPRWEYKSLCWCKRGFFSFNDFVWRDAAGREYGPPGRYDALGLLNQTEAALRLLDAEGWELVSFSGAAGGAFLVLRRPSTQ